MSKRISLVSILSLLILSVVMITLGCEQKQSPRQTGQTGQSSGSQYGTTYQPSNAKKIQLPADFKVEWDLENLPGDAVSSTTDNFLFVIDASGSMRGDKIRAAISALKSMIDDLPDNINVGFMGFDERGNDKSVEVYVPIQPINKTLLLKAVGELKAGDGTPLAEAVIMGIDMLVKQRQKQMGYGDYRLIVMTDGEDDGDGPSIKDAGMLALRKAISIYTIGYEIDKDHELFNYSVWYTTTHGESALLEALNETVSESEDFEPTEFEAIQ